MYYTMPAKKFSLTLKPNVGVSDFIRTLNRDTISKGNLNGIKKGDVVMISYKGGKGIFYWDGAKLIQDKYSENFSKNLSVPTDFLTFDPYPIGHWKTDIINVSWTRLKFIKNISIPNTRFFNDPRKYIDMYEYKLQGNNNKTYKVISDLAIDSTTPVIGLQKSLTPGYKFEVAFADYLD